MSIRRQGAGGGTGGNTTYTTNQPPNGTGIVGSITNSQYLHSSVGGPIPQRNGDISGISAVASSTQAIYKTNTLD
jgi:hypothetical protein